MYDNTIIDNNLLRKITQIDNYHLYEKYVIQLSKLKLIDFSVTRNYFTSAGVLEFLGQKLPVIKTNRSEYYHEKAKEILSANKGVSETNTLRAELLTELEATLKSQNLYSEALVNEWIQKRKDNTEKKTHGFVFDSIDAGFKDNVARGNFYNRVALDRTFLFDWEEPFQSLICASYLADLHHAYELELSFGSARGLSEVWKNFSGQILYTITYEKALKAGTVKKLGLKEPRLKLNRGDLSDGQLVQNITYVTSKVSYKEDGDYTDVEAIHFLCVGRFFDSVCRPVLFSTQDRFEDLIVRIALFKSFYKKSYEMMKDDDSAVPPICPGMALQFDQDVILKYKILISEVDALLDILGMKKITDWIESMKEKFKVT